MEAGMALLFGLLIGSFLNVCIHRWPRNRSVVKPRSHCVRCRKPIAWYDNIPVVSYIVLGGRCRYCRKSISWRYPLVELLTGGLFFVVVLEMGATPVALKMCIFSAIMVALIFCDLEKRILPDEFTIGGMVIGLAFAFFGPVKDSMATIAHLVFSVAGLDVSPRITLVAESAFGAFLPALSLWGVGWLYSKIRHRDGLGLGDVKLVAMAGSFLGVQGALLTLILGSISGTIIGYGYIKLTGKDPSTYELPFGTFLGAGGLAAAVMGQRLLGL